jgi:amidohydrolase
MEEREYARVKEAVLKHSQKARELSADLYANPEVSNKEFESSRKIAALLEKAGFAVELPYCGLQTAFRADFNNGTGPEVALMVEYDALPEIGHGCGHNLHGSVSVLAGLALLELKDLFKGKLSVIGTPNEEIDGGKIPMAAKGIFDTMALAMMVHSASGGYSQANMDALSLRSCTLEFRGQTAHAVADPWMGRSALAAARKCIDLIDARRECFAPGVKVNAIITDGGRSVNVIPEYAQLCMEFRTLSMGSLGLVDDMLKKCARGAAMALDCEVSWRLNYDDFADMVRITSLEDEAADILRSLGAKLKPVSSPLGSTDVGNVSYRCPTIQPLLSITSEDLAMHSREFADSTQKTEGLNALSTGAEALALLGLKVFRDEDFRTRIHTDFRESLDQKLKT